MSQPSILTESLARARKNSEIGAYAGRQLSLKAAASFDMTGAVAGNQSGTMSSILGGQSQAMRSKNFAYFKDWVYVVIMAIGRRVSGQPFGAGMIQGDSGQKQSAITMTKSARAKALMRAPAWVKRMTSTGRDIEPLQSHEALDLLDRPNKLQGKVEFLLMTICNLYLTGEFYWIGGPSKASKEEPDRTHELWAVPVPWLIPKHEGGLFTSYVLKPPGVEGEGTPIPRELVYRGYFPDPLDYKKALSPVTAEQNAVVIDESIQKSQATTFKRGPYPQVAVEIGDRKGPDNQNLGKPVLTGGQRRQIVRAITEVMRASTEHGDPAIIDGLIAGIHKLQLNGSEMDYLQSGESVKKRIFQAMAVNPYIVGDQLPGSRAQSAVAEQNYVDNVINPLVNMFSTAVQSFVTPMFDGDSDTKTGLALWLEEATPKDDELDLRRIGQAAGTGMASVNEQRSAYKMPPLEGEIADFVGFINTPAGKQAVLALATQVGTGQLAPETAEELLVYWGATEAWAKKFVGTIKIQPPMAGGMFGGGGPGFGGPNAGGGKPPAAGGDANKPAKPPPPDQPDDTGDQVPAVDDAGQDSGKQLVPLAKSGDLPKITRGVVKAVNARQRAKLEREAAAGLVPFFVRSSSELLQDLLDEATLQQTNLKLPA